MSGNLLLEAYVFVLALFVGFQLISKVPSILHTPLMSGTNAIHGIILVGAIVLAGSARGPLGTAVGAVAVFLATMNVVGGFVVTDRMLEMFRQRPTTRAPEQSATRAPQQPTPAEPAQKARRA
jgi:NAD(P) transhydrogenase subunit alpha